MLKIKWFHAKILLLIIVFSLLFVSFVNAFAVSSAYGSGNPLIIYPGETKEVQLELMTSPGEDNLVIMVELVDNGGIADLIDYNKRYNVNAGENVPVNLKISVDKSAKIWENYNIIIKFSDITPSEGEGSVSFKGSSTISFGVLVAQPELKEAKEGIGLFFIFGFFLLILIILVGSVVWLLIKNRKPRNY